MQTMVTFECDTLTVRPWADEVIDSLGFDPRAPVRGALLAGGARARARPGCSGASRPASTQHPDGFEMSLGETARALGLGDRGGRHSPFLRTVNRMIQFELAQVVTAGAGELAVRRRLPPLNRRQTARLSPALQAAHERWQAEQLQEPPGEAQRRRGRQLALSLLELGEDVEEAERQLLRWRYHPALAREARRLGRRGPSQRRPRPKPADRGPAGGPTPSRGHAGAPARAASRTAAPDGAVDRALGCRPWTGTFRTSLPVRRVDLPGRGRTWVYDSGRRGRRRPAGRRRASSCSSTAGRRPRPSTGVAASPL